MKAQNETGIVDTLREKIEIARKKIKENPGAFGPKLGLAILKKCQQVFYTKLAGNKYIIVPKGKTFEKSMQLRMPIFSIVDTPINDSILTDRFYIKNDEDKHEASILQQIANNRGSMVDMYAIANQLQLMHLKDHLPEPSGSMNAKRK